MHISAKSLAILLLPLTLAAWLDSDETRSTSFVESGHREQPYPANYKPEILAFLRTYLNNPVGVHDAAWPSRCSARSAAGSAMSAACASAARESDGSYREPRSAPCSSSTAGPTASSTNAADDCAGAAYVAFPELEKLTR